MSLESLGKRKYEIFIVEYFSAKTDIIFLAARSPIYQALQQFIEIADRKTNFRLQAMRLEDAGEHKR